MSANFNTFMDFAKHKGSETLEGMKAEELAGLYNEYNEVKRKELTDLIAEKSEESSEQIEALKQELFENQKEQLKNLNQALKEQGLAIKALTQKELDDSKLTVRQQIRKHLSENIDKLKALKDGSKQEAAVSGFDFEFKAMTISGNISGGNVPVEDRLPDFNIIPSRQIRLLDIMSQRNTSSNVVSWVYQNNKTGTTGQTGEGLAKNEIAFDIVVASDTVKKTTAFIKVSTEMLDDIEWIESEINNELMRELLKQVESQAYSGDGLGNNHNGIRTLASAFAAGSFAAAVDNANIVDVLTVAMNQIEVAQEGVMANYILMHPTDVTSLKLVKLSATDKRYVDRLIMVGSTLMLDGVPIIKTTLVTQGEYLVGNFDLSILVTRTGMRIDIGLDADDFTKNLRTILIEWRGLTIVKNNDRTAFVAGVFATDAAALETV